MKTVTVELREDTPKKDGTFPIRLRITIDRANKYIGIGHSVKKSQFRSGLSDWIIKHPDAELINAVIEKKRRDLVDKLTQSERNNEQVHAKDIGKKAIAPYTFLQALRERMQVYEQREQVPAYNRLKAKKKILMDAWGKDIPLAQLNNKWIEKYVAHRIKAGMKISTIKKDLKDFATVLNNVDEKHWSGKNIFSAYQPQLKAEDAQIEKLTPEEIKMLEVVPLEGLADIARDVYLFAYYCQGMRFQNAILFKSSDIKDGHILYRMNKGKKIREVELHKKLQAIIDKYAGNKPHLFPVVKKEPKDNWEKKTLVDNANALLTPRLKRAAIIAGIEKHIHYHTARHSIASHALDSGVSMEILKDMLGHSDFSTTQRYLKRLSDDKINKAVKGLYD